MEKILTKEKADILCFVQLCYILLYSDILTIYDIHGFCMFIVALYNVHLVCTLQLLYSAVLECLQYFLYFHCSRTKTKSRYTEWQWPLFGVHSIMMVKSAQPGEVGVHALPFSFYLSSQAKFWCTLQQIHYFSSIPICTLHCKGR